MRFSMGFTVRDYECDLQGVVNNAVYLNYLEHTRHSYLLSRGVDFAALHAAGIDAVVSRIEIDYKRSLTSGNTFESILEDEPQGRMRHVFHQEIRRGDELIVKAKVIAAVTQNGRPVPTASSIPQLAP